MDQNLNWNLLHQFAKELGEEGHDYKIHKRSLSDTVSTHKEIVIEYGYNSKETQCPTKLEQSSAIIS
jgi:hypothetical protein